MAANLRIFHTADVHLGLTFARYDAAAAALRETRYRTFESLVKTANEERCNLFVVAGDLFDRISMNVGDITRTARALDSFEGELVLVLPGNHDYIGPDSELWNRFNDLSGDRTLLLSEAKAYDLAPHGISATVYAAPCPSRHSSENRIAWIHDDAVRPATEFHIGIAHGAIVGISPDLEGKYYPMTIAQLQNAGLDLWLLGHTHITYPDRPSVDSVIFNPGTPEPDGLDCPHPGHAFIIDISRQENGKSGMTRKLLDTGSFRFCDVTVPVEEVGDDVRLNDERGRGEALARAREAIGGPDPARTLARIRWTGRATRTQIDSIRELEQLLRDSLFWAAFDDSDLSEAVTREKIDSEFPEISFPHQLLSLFIDEDDPEATDVAYSLLRDAMSHPGGTGDAR